MTTEIAKTGLEQGLQAIRTAQEEARANVAVKIVQANERIANSQDLMQLAYEYFGALKPNSR